MPFSQSSTVFTILPAQSEARFLIEEIFNGAEKVVVGATNQVSGQIAIDPSDPATAAVGPVQVDANSLVTDNGFRDRAIRSRILLAGIYQFITFTPTAVRGLPETITSGETVEFAIDGDLTATTITQPVTFTVTATVVSNSRLAGQATTTIQRGDFDLVVPSATGVAAVAEEVRLELDFVAGAAEQQ
jgi:polyisoprenoid-binding protein YceI